MFNNTYAKGVPGSEVPAVMGAGATIRIVVDLRPDHGFATFWLKPSADGLEEEVGVLEGLPLRGVALGVNMNVAAGSGLDQLFRRVRGRRHAPCCGALSDRLGHPATHRGCLAGALALPCPVALLPVV